MRLALRAYHSHEKKTFHSAKLAGPVIVGLAHTSSDDTGVLKLTIHTSSDDTGVLKLTIVNLKVDCVRL